MRDDISRRVHEPDGRFSVSTSARNRYIIIRFVFAVRAFRRMYTFVRGIANLICDFFFLFIPFLSRPSIQIIGDANHAINYFIARSFVVCVCFTRFSLQLRFLRNNYSVESVYSPRKRTVVQLRNTFLLRVLFVFVDDTSVIVSATYIYI